jgi:hypothetical protein
MFCCVSLIKAGIGGSSNSVSVRRVRSAAACALLVDVDVWWLIVALALGALAEAAASPFVASFSAAFMCFLDVKWAS